MSIFPPQTVVVVSQSLPFGAVLSSDVASSLAPDVEYRMREVIQEALKCMRHGKRSILTVADISSALSLLGCEPLFGAGGTPPFAMPADTRASGLEPAAAATAGGRAAAAEGDGASMDLPHDHQHQYQPPSARISLPITLPAPAPSGGPRSGHPGELASLHFRSAAGHPDVFFLEDQEVDCQEVLTPPLPPPPMGVSAAAHWLALDGVQPAVPENLPLPKAGHQRQAGKLDAVLGGIVPTGGSAGLAVGSSDEETAASVSLKPAVKHVLSKELQMYFERVVELVILGASSTGSPHTSSPTAPNTTSRPLLADSLPLQAPAHQPGQQQGRGSQQQVSPPEQSSPVSDRLLPHALRCVATDSGLQPILPYFIHFVADEVSRSLEDLPLLTNLMGLVRSLLKNSNLHIEPYLHQLMPSVLTCLIAKRIGGQAAVPMEEDISRKQSAQGNVKGSRLSRSAQPYVPLGHDGPGCHWALRDLAASLVKFVCFRYGGAYSGLQARLCRTLMHTLLDPQRTLPQHYGAIKGISALGPKVAAQLLLPNIGLYSNMLEECMQVPGVVSAEADPNPLRLRQKLRKKFARRQEAWKVWGAIVLTTGQALRFLLSSELESNGLAKQLAKRTDRGPRVQQLIQKDGHAALKTTPVGHKMAKESRARAVQSGILLEELLPARQGPWPPACSQKRVSEAAILEHLQQRQESVLGASTSAHDILDDSSLLRRIEELQVRREKMSELFPSIEETGEGYEDDVAGGNAMEVKAEGLIHRDQLIHNQVAGQVPQTQQSKLLDSSDDVLKALELLGEPLLPFLPGTFHMNLVC